MTSNTSETDSPVNSRNSSLPQAQLKHQRGWPYVWMLPVIAVTLAAWLVIDVWQQQGAMITIRFQQGYGLKPGDALRYRGIDAGQIESVQLADDLSSLWVNVRLIPSAEDLARNGSRFWIVRPQLGLTGVSGLDTVVGANYLSLLPGRGEPQNQFVGLEQPPFAGIREPGGLEIVLTTSGKGSLTAGTPISYRQVIIGHLLAVDLAKDASTVEAKAYIKPDYTNLIRENIRFWRTSAARVSAGIGGFSVDVDSVHSLVLGGINLAIPPQPGKRVDQSFHFQLYDKPDEQWLDWIPGLSLYDDAELNQQSRPYLIAASLRWSYRDWMYWQRSDERRAWLLPLAQGLLGPADVLKTPEDAIEGSVQLWLQDAPLNDVAPAQNYSPELALLPVEHDYPIWSETQIRVSDKPEDSLIIASPDLPTRFIGADRYQVDAGSWLVDAELPFDNRWHGAAVMAESDGKLLGLLLVSEDDVRVVVVKGLTAEQAAEPEAESETQ